MGFLGSLFGGGSDNDEIEQQTRLQTQELRRHNLEVEAQQREQLARLDLQQKKLDTENRQLQDQEAASLRRSLVNQRGRRSGLATAVSLDKLGTEDKLGVGNA